MVGLIGYIATSDRITQGGWGRGILIALILVGGAAVLIMLITFPFKPRGMRFWVVDIKPEPFAASLVDKGGREYIQVKILSERYAQEMANKNGLRALGRDMSRVYEVEPPTKEEQEKAEERKRYLDSLVDR